MTAEYRKIKQYLKLLSSRQWEKAQPVENITYRPCDYKTGNTPPADGFVPYDVSGTWGTGWDSHAWFHFTLPAVEPATYLRVCTERNGWDADNPQFMAYINGEMRQGMDTNHREVRLDPDIPLDVYLYAYTGPKVKSARLTAELVKLNEDVNGLYYDLYYPFETLDFLAPESNEYAQTLRYLFRAVSLLRMYDPDSEDFLASVREARDYMAGEFYGKYCGERDYRTVCIGHTHIDCAWKWTLKQTREKVQRSFGTVLELMRRYPEYKFMSSQAFLYQNLKEENPALYAQVADRIREGRWECEGAMWVEADCNLSSGESLVRQVLYGKNFFSREFGAENRVLWLPDVFGYSAAMPQILRRSGVDWFVTSKISWNDANRMPCDTFLWRGIDGTGIYSYFLTAQNDKGGPSDTRTTYVAKTDAQMISGAYKRYQQKQLSPEALLTFGFGDGGGGPTEEHLELMRRGAHGLPGTPGVSCEFAGDFLRRVGERIEAPDAPALPVWQGELYLEFHRGTYTTQAKNKLNNRRSEFLYERAELCSVLGQKLPSLNLPSSAAELHRGWEMILTNQFHDIIPGSSIHEVYEQCARDYAEIFAIGNGVTGRFAAALADSTAAEDGYVVFNPHSFAADGPVKINGKTVIAENVPPKGYKIVKSFRDGCRVIADTEGRVLENDDFRISFAPDWQICGITDKKAGREVLSAGQTGNQLRVYPDWPDHYDAWEWQEYSRDEYTVLTDVKEIAAVDDGARRGIRIVRAFGASLFTQTIWLCDRGGIFFETEVDWHQRHQMLKTAFPVDVNADKATYEIQFGTIERPTHFNTEWDRQKFEVCAHKYADLSDGGYGVSLINDCKYGHDVHDGVMLLSLLRSPTDPDPEADQGIQRFTYALLPHDGPFSAAAVQTARQAYLLNDPLTAIPAAGKRTVIPAEYSLVAFDRDNVICETVKDAEDGSGDTIVRLYEFRNAKTTVTADLSGLGAARVQLCDLLERPEEELELRDGKVTFPVRGFEIVTLRIR